ncbi:MAG: RagB/SusD family nutrient uptake outer membrane protein [Bacteroidota bacterium]
MLKKRIIKFSAVFALVAILAACGEDFLNAPAQGSLDEGTLANQAGAEAALISAYSMLDGWNNNWGQLTPWPTAGSNWVWSSATSDDAYKGSEPGDQGEISEIELYNWLPANPYLESKFKVVYEGAARGNAALRLLDNALEAGEAIPQEDIDRITGEVKALRAHFHFEAVKMWGDVPYYTENDEDFRKPSGVDPYPFLEADLNDAIAVLPEDQAEVGRITQGAARAYLGKVLLYQGKFAEAKAQFDNVVNSGKYALQDCYKDIFTAEGENGSEMIFSVQSSVNDGTGGGENGNFADRLNFPHGGSPFGCCGFHQPSQNLVNAHKVDANGLPLLDSFNDADYDPATDVVDPRLDWTVGRDDVPYLDWGIHEPSWIRSRSWAGPYSPKKFAYNVGEESSVGWSNRQLSPINVPLIRYSDVLLMLAECEVEVGSLERARELVNMIRMRAGNCAQGADGNPTTDLADAGITWATYAVGTYDEAWTDKDVAREAVRFERRLELALEGHRFFDLRRYGLDYASDILNTYVSEEVGKRSYLSAAATFESKHMLYPYPSQQVELSKIDGVEQLTQNPGW